MTTMNERRYRRNTKLLWALIWAALGYSMWFYRRDMLTGNPTTDGTLSVIFGLYICSRPAGNAIDLLFIERTGFHRFVSQWSSIRWLALNLLTLLMGWILIYLGTTHLMSRPD